MNSSWAGHPWTSDITSYYIRPPLERSNFTQQGFPNRSARASIQVSHSSYDWHQLNWNLASNDLFLALSPGIDLLNTLSTGI